MKNGHDWSPASMGIREIWSTRMKMNTVHAQTILKSKRILNEINLLTITSTLQKQIRNISQRAMGI